MGGIVWLASYPKSGNTWTRNFLHNLLVESDSTYNINNMKLLTTWDCAAAWYQPFLSRPVKDCSKKEVAEIRLKAIQRIADNTDDLIFVKTHNAMVADQGIPMINTSVTAGAIYIVRNPLDVAVSYSHHLNKSIDETIRFMNLRGAQHPNSETTVYEVQSSWSENVYSWTRKQNPALHIMRYEDMLDKPVETFGQLVNFLQINTTMEKLEEAIQASSFDKLKEQEEKFGFSEKPTVAREFFRVGKAGQWRDVLSRNQIDEIIKSNQEQMKRFDYMP